MFFKYTFGLIMPINKAACNWSNSKKVKKLNTFSKSLRELPLETDTQLTFTCTKSTKATPEKDVEYVQN